MNAFCRYSLPVSIVLILAPFSRAAGVGDPTLETDHPHYPGEGALQETEDCVRFATKGLKGDQERALALYSWLLRHQYHLASPQEWRVPGIVPDSAHSDNFDLMVYDANRARFSYGYGLCGTVHAWNEVYWKAAGFRARRRAFPGHTNSEVEYGGNWHAFDTDMAGLLWRADGTVAGYEDIIQDGLLPRKKNRYPCYPFAWPEDFETMTLGWKEVAAGGPWYKMYDAGYEGMPGIVCLRPGESLTRYFDPDHFGGPTRRRFWQHQAGGPHRDWTFVAGLGEVPEEVMQTGRGNASYCNAEFVFQPELSESSLHEVALSTSESLGVRKTGQPALVSITGERAWVIFDHFSPYVIAGDPEDDANPMTGHATDGLKISGRMSGTADISISSDQGQSWSERHLVTGMFQLDLTDAVKGRYGWQIRIELEGDAQLEEVTFVTTCQMSQSIYPRLTNDGCDVTWRVADRNAVPIMPNFGESLEALPGVIAHSENLEYLGRGPHSRLAFRTTDHRPGEVVLQVDAPAPLTEVRAAFRYQLRIPVPENTDFSLAVSTDSGASWQTFAEASIPADNEYSTGWISGRVEVRAADSTSARIRARCFQDGYETGIGELEAYGLYQTSPPSAAVVTYGWKEGEQLKTHTETVPAGAHLHAFHVPTGANIVNDFVRMEASRE